MTWPRQTFTELPPRYSTTTSSYSEPSSAAPANSQQNSPELEPSHVGENLMADLEYIASRPILYDLTCEEVEPPQKKLWAVWATLSAYHRREETIHR